MHRALIILLLAVASVRAATIPAASIARADVASAISSASSGDTVTVPAGTTTTGWSSRLTIPDGIKVIGAGMGQSIITSDGDNGIFQANDETWIEGFTFKSDGTGSTSDDFIRANGTNIVIKDVEADCASNWTGNNALMLIYDEQQSVTPNGVVSGAIFRDTRAVINSPYINGMHARFAQPTELGSQDTWYFEDCIFLYVNTAHTALDANYSGSYVARFNTFSNCQPSSHTIQSLNGRAARKVEIYGNSFVGGAQAKAASIAASTGVFFSNDVSSAVHISKRVVQLSYERAYASVGDGGKADGHSNWDGNTPLYSGTHTGANNASVLTDGSKSWTVNQFVISGWSRWIRNTTDGSKVQITANTATTVTGTLSGGSQNDWDTGDTYEITDGWPARDQPGTGQDAVTWPSPYLGAAPVQALEPIYIWANTGFATPIVELNDQGAPQSEQLIQEGRDYKLEAHPSYTMLDYPHPLLGESSGGGSSGGGNVNVNALRIGTIQVAP